MPPNIQPSLVRTLSLEHKARQIILAHLADADLSVQLLAKKVGLSRSQLHRRLKKEGDYTPSQLIREVRIEEAGRLLQQPTPQSISETAYAVGFQSLSHFTRSFREYYGVPPSVYAKTKTNDAT